MPHMVNENVPQEQVDRDLAQCTAEAAKANIRYAIEAPLARRDLTRDCMLRLGYREEW